MSSSNRDEDSGHTSDATRIKNMLLDLGVELKQRAKQFEGFTGPLLFASPPNIFSDSIALLESEISIPMLPNRGPFPLQIEAPDNVAFLAYQAWLLDAFSEAEVFVSEHPIKAIRSVAGDVVISVRSELVLLENLKKDEWRRQYERQRAARQQAAAGIPVYDTSEYFLYHLRC